jgi:hypothetical protein
MGPAVYLFWGGGALPFGARGKRSVDHRLILADAFPLAVSRFLVTAPRFLKNRVNPRELIAPYHRLKSFVNSFFSIMKKYYFSLDN